MRPALPLALVPLLVACAPWTRLHGANDVPCGVDDAPACMELFPKPPPPPPVTPERIRTVQALIAETCPPPTAEDPTPGLSNGARAYVPPRGRVCRSPLGELGFLETLLPETPRDDPHRPRYIERLAWIYTWLEHGAYLDCRSFVVLPDVNAEELESLEQRAKIIALQIRTSRKQQKRLCKMLRRDYPERPLPSACGGQ